MRKSIVTLSLLLIAVAFGPIAERSNPAFVTGNAQSPQFEMKAREMLKKIDDRASAADPEENITVGTEVGQAYPDYMLPSIADGRPLALSKFRGRKIILHQFASW